MEVNSIKVPFIELEKTIKVRMPVADVILYHGDGLVSKLMRFFDGTVVNHAGLYIGEGKVGEALVGNAISKQCKY